MKIIDLRVRCVAIPLNAQLRHNTGVHPGYFLRTILEIITDEGIVGLGEVGGGDQRAALTRLKPRILGLDPFHLELVKLRVLRSIYYISNSRLYAAIEMACLDIQGKALGRPASDLLGGRVRDTVPMIAYLFWRYDRPQGGDDECAEDMADFCEELHETLGVNTMKLKAGVMPPDEEARVVELDPVSIVATIGERSSQPIPFTEQIWTRRAYHAHFDPEQAGLWVSADRGWIEPGATEMPFKVLFEPSSGRTLESTLIVSFGAFEMRASITASTGEEPKRHRKHAK
jgi:hypothetical protein